MQKTKDPSKATIIKVKALLFGQMFLHAMDDMYHFGFYSHLLKKLGKAFTEHLEVHIKEDIKNLYDYDEVAINKVEKSYDVIVKRLVSLDHSTMLDISNVLEKGYKSQTIRFSYESLFSIEEVITDGSKDSEEKLSEILTFIQTLKDNHLK